MNNCLRRLSRLVLVLIAGIVALGSVGEMYAQDRVTFSLQNRREVNGTYYAELWASVASGQTWHVGGTSVNVYYNSAALIAGNQTAVFDAHPDLHNSGSYQSMTQSDYGTGTALTIVNLSLTSFSNKTGSFKVGTFTWSVVSPGAFDNLAIAVPPAADASVVLDSNNTLGYNCGNGTCYNATQPLSRIIGTPVITGQPGNLVACAGQPAAFTVTSTGSSLTYTWQYSATTNGTFTTISGQTGPTLAISSVTTGNAGAYRVIVSNTTGSVTSNVVTLNVNTTPVIVSQPSNFTACAGGNAVFNTQFTSSTPVTFQWQVFDDLSSTFVNITGATTATLAINNVTASQSGSQYRAQLTNTCGVSTTNVVTLFVNTAPVVNLTPTNQAACSGASVSFTANANGTPAPSVQWQVSVSGGAFTNLPGETSGTLTLANIQSSQNGNMYHAVFTNSCGVATTASAMLTVYTSPIVTTQPVNQTGCETSSVSFTAAASGTPAPTTQWEVSTNGGGIWTPIAGQTTGTLTVANLAASQNGNQYRAVFTNLCATVTSVPATLNVNTTPVVSVQPASQSVCENGTVSFTAAANAVPAPAIQWQVNTTGAWVNIAGETTGTLTVSNILFAQSGAQYRAMFTNVCGTTNSNAAVLTVNRMPQTASVAPSAQPICAGSSVTFTASSTGGTPTPTVQWQSRPTTSASFTNISGATSLALTFTAATADNGTQYRAVFTNTCGTITSSAATLTVNNIALVITQPVNQTQCAGGSVSFTSFATGSPAPTMQWQVSVAGGGYTNLADGGNISGVQTTTLTLTNVAANQSGNSYRLAFTNTCGTVTSNGANLTVNVPPVVTNNPVSRDTCAGSTVTFTAAATATPAATIQWQVMAGTNGTWTAISGQTTGTLTLTNITLGQSGTMYRALFTNACGTTASAAATLTINLGPSVATNPASQTVCEGQSVTFTAAAIGSPTPTIQWEVSTNGGGNYSAIAGATNASYTIASPAFAQNGSMYRAVFSNVCGTVASNGATLTVNTVPVVTTNPTNQTVCAGNNATFTAAASGSPAPTIQWEVSIGGGAFTAIPGATSTTYTFTAGQNDNGNMYRAVFTNVCGVAQSTPAMLNFYALPAITQQPTAVAVCQGNSFTLTVGAVGTGLTYQWRKDNIDIPNTNSASYTVAAASASDAGFYTVVVSNICNQPVESNPVSVVVNANPVITVQPVPVTVCQGDFAQFSVQTSGTGLSFQWRKDNTNIPGATNTFYNIPAAQLTDAGSYTVAITGACGTPVISNAASLTVLTGPAITSQPTSVVVCAGNAATFTVGASGSNLTYQWQFNGNNIPSTGATLTLNSVTAANAGNYRVVVTASCGTPVTSATVTLTVNQPPVIVGDVQNQTVCEGQSVTFTVDATGTGLAYQWTFNGSPIPGANGRTYTVNNASINNAGDYQVTITGTCPTNQPVRSRLATLTVYNNVVITVQPQSVSTCFGYNFLLSVSASGSGLPPSNNLTYQWYKDGVPIPGATNNQLTFFSAQYVMSGTYTVAVTGICGTVVSNPAVVVVNRLTSAILKDRDINAAVGDTVVLEVSDVSGSGTTFQWYKDGVELNDVPGHIFGSKSSKLFIFGVQSSDESNNYYVVVNGPCGIATSDVASLNLFNPNVQFTEQPVSDVTLCENAPLNLSATATTNIEGGILRYQWLKDGVVIPGANQRTFMVTTATLLTAGSYYVEVTEMTKSITVTSNNAIVTVLTAPRITDNPISESFCPGAAASLSVAVNAEAGTNLTYQWFKDGQPISAALNPSATTATLVGPVNALTVGNYNVVVTNQCGTATSSMATVSMKTQTVITQQPESKSLDTLGVSELRLKVVAQGENCAYQWRLNGNIIAGATSDEYVVLHPTLADTGRYTVDVICECGTTTSTVAVIGGFTTDVDEPVAGEGFYLFQNYPNPFNGLTSIKYQVPASTDVRISVTDMYGREVAVLVNGMKQAGQHTMTFDASQLPSGTYFYTMTATGFNTSRRMLLVK